MVKKKIIPPAKKGQRRQKKIYKKSKGPFPERTEARGYTSSKVGKKRRISAAKRYLKKK
jgi:hypothetical protein